MIEKDITKPVRKIMEEVWNQMQVHLLPAFCQADARMYLPDGTIEGCDRLVVEFIAPVLDAFPDIRHEIDEFIVDGNCIAMRYRGSGTHEKEFGGKSATGKRLDYEGITIFHLKDEKVHEIWNHSNWSDALAAL